MEEDNFFLKKKFPLLFYSEIIMVILRQKNYAFFGNTIANFGKMKSALGAGNLGQAAKFGGNALWNGAKGVGKGALVTGAIGVGAAGLIAKDALTGNLGS